MTEVMHIGFEEADRIYEQEKKKQQSPSRFGILYEKQWTTSSSNFFRKTLDISDYP